MKKAPKAAQENTADDIEYNGPALAAAALDDRDQPDFNEPERAGHEVVADATRIASAN